MESMESSESYMVISTRGNEFRYRLFPEDVELLKKALSRDKSTSFLDYLSFMISVFDKVPVQNVPKEWGKVYEWEVFGVDGVPKVRKIQLSMPAFIRAYLKSRGVKFPEVSPDEIRNEALHQVIIDKQKNVIGEKAYVGLYKRLYEIIG